MFKRGTFRFLATVSVIISVAFATSLCKINGNSYNFDTVINKDFAIIGGGSGGVYSAVRLKDLGKSLVVIEAKNRLGGHTETYIEPKTNAPFDLGVLFFHNFTEVTNYFNRLNVSYTSLSLGDESSDELGTAPKYVDFSTGKVNSTFVPGGTASAFSQAFSAYSKEVLKYPYLDYGYSLPDPVPAELYIPFGDFVKKHSLDALANFAWQFTQGIGNLLQTPTIYVIKYLGISSIISIHEGFLSTTRHYNSLIYLSAQTILGTDVLYSSTVLDIERNKDGVLVAVQTGGKKILVKAQKLIVSIQPTLANLRPLDLDHHEKRLFGKFKYSQYCSGVLYNTGIPDDVNLESYSPSLPYTVPVPPAIYALGQTGLPGLMNVHYVTTNHMTDAEIDASIIAQIEKVSVPGKTAGKPEMVIKTNHKPFQLHVSSNDIKNGFYADLLALQGKKRTWYISATLHTHDSSLIWRYMESLLPELLT